MLFPLQKPSQARALNYAQPSNRKMEGSERQFPDTRALCSDETGLGWNHAEPFVPFLLPFPDERLLIRTRL